MCSQIECIVLPQMQYKDQGPMETPFQNVVFLTYNQPHYILTVYFLNLVDLFGAGNMSYYLLHLYSGIPYCYDIQTRLLSLDWYASNIVRYTYYKFSACCQHNNWPFYWVHFRSVTFTLHVCIWNENVREREKEE